MSRKELCHLSDEVLFQHYKDTRNPSVFRLLYDRHKDSLYRYCLQMAPSSTTPLLQQLWRGLLENPPELHGRRLKNWLFIHINKRLKQEYFSNLKVAEEEVQSHNRVLFAIQKLPTQLRNVLLLHMECKLPLVTVADIERLSLHKCRSLYYQARAMLEEYIDGAERKPWQVEVIEESSR
ncbi:RNA polymerase sigma factor [Microbulbifer sp. SSSA002]|uniref:RNA polymerase sigma factor n=1 Tax=unclassified Microbulbifer TaxID=2619833 RepID=UPI00403955A5